MKPISSHIISTSLFIVCFCFTFAFSETIPKTGVINDEAIELLVSEDLPTDRVYFFAPNYQGGNVTLIESLVPYVNLAIMSISGHSLIFLHLFFALCHAGACYLFFRLLQAHFQQTSFALYGAILLGGASYANFFNRILTRNGISMLWSCLILLVLYQALKTSQTHRRNVLYWLILPVVLTFAFWTYTSFKFIIVAIYLSLGLWAVFQSFSSRYFARRAWRYPLLSCILTLCCIAGLLLISQTSFHFTIFRGSYVLGGNWAEVFRKYASHFVSSLLLPVYFKPGGDFLIEVTHTAYNRQTLSIFLAPCFILGVWNSLTFKKSSFGFQQLVLCIWLLGTAMLALGGPQLKHHFALFPIVMFLAICGLWRVAEWVSLMLPPRSFNIVAVIFLLAVVGGETNHLFRKIPLDSLLRLDSGLPAAVAREALQQAQTVSKVYLIEGWGRDAVRYYTRYHPNIRYILNHLPIPIEMENDLQTNQSIAIVTDRDAPPEFFTPHPFLSSRFRKQSQPGERWVVTTYFSTPDTSHHEEIP
ncbi:4-amino-4-deoxy-L-arabinose transferase and related glycosyltransferase of PMT family [Candidatus Vecturithrix granuli]|uniref:4-amino-4-deoxy-L-arabinose transferase and related glycosyltransferase of PMT family n=1 Tax=Vecturithrix granuli TaxID=1499967 RepID=A0A081C1Q3_VECG1|nr:4-amino-4-deoxy-L-arabinose transferase and related glycosyltransferase of PMT family [Candidatus Vecturithrix granuli]